LTNLANHGIAVYAQEAHGHGTSEPTQERNRALVWDFNHLIQDAAGFANEVLQNQPSIPAFIGGQSLGGLISAHVALLEQSKWSGLVLCSAAMNIEWTLALRLQAPLGGLFASLVPRARLVPAVKPEDMSPDPKVVQDYVNDKLNFIGPVRARTGNEILKGFRSLEHRQAQLHLPILAVHGTSDRCTSLPAVKRLLEACQSKDITLKEMPGGYHELIMGPEKEQVIPMVREWILAHAGTTAAKM
ncbi:MAG: alpha beta hydrolase, partial [Trebouxia sp. A1-2]